MKSQIRRFIYVFKLRDLCQFQSKSIIRTGYQTKFPACSKILPVRNRSENQAQSQFCNFITNLTKSEFIP